MILEGDTLGERYRLVSVLGRGGNGTVFRAHDLQLGRDVAVKVIEKARATQHARFEREARVGAGLDHPHIVQTLDRGAAGDALFLVTQLVEDGDLLAFRRRNHALAISTVLVLARQIADGLAAAHAHGVVHRDLKPENILVEEHGPWARIADFGLAFSLSPPDPRQGRLTVDGSVSGTPTYMAPEQVTNGEVGPPSDVYALGCVLHELIVGTPPFRGAHGKVFAEHLYAPVRSMRATRSDVPSALDELVLRMLAKPAHDRPTAEQARNRLALLDEPPQRSSSRDIAITSLPPVDRSQRSLTQPPPLIPVPKTYAARIAVVGEASLDLLAAFELAELEAVPSNEDYDACLVLDGDAADVAVAVASGRPVIADADAKDFSRITQMLRLGATEVVTRPIVPAIVVFKLQRVLRRSLR